MQHASRAGSGGLEHGECIILCFPGVDDQRLAHLQSEFYLSLKNRPLDITRGVVVMVVESALAYARCAAQDGLANKVDVARRVERRGFVGMRSRRPADKPRILRRDLAGRTVRIEY